MTPKKRVILEVWYSEYGLLCFTDDPKFMLSCPNKTPDFVFLGKEVDYWVHAPNDDFTRDVALDVCRIHHERKYVTQKFDLSTLNPPAKKVARKAKKQK